MAVYYLDTSALVKRYALESGTSWVMRLTNPASGHDLYTVHLTGPEMMAALFRKARTGAISRAEAIRLSGNFEVDWKKQYQIVEVSPQVADRAMVLIKEHTLRGHDAVHLAAALALHDLRCAMKLPALVFVSADDEQLRAAEAKGLPTENPNQYP